MGSLDRSKRRVQLWKKAVFHFLLCFVMGFFMGFAPIGKNSSSWGRTASNLQSREIREFSPQPVETLHQLSKVANLKSSLIAETPVAVPAGSSGDSEGTSLLEEDEAELIPRKQLILITPTRSNDPTQGVFLMKMANTLKLVPPPLLWIVVEGQSDSSEFSEMLRKTGIMYRHLVFKENFTDPEAELDHQMNVALNHIEHHRLNGIVHFAEASNVYDLDFFEEIRGLEVFGTWPVALISANRNRVVIEGPVCDFSQVIGWHLRSENNQMDTTPSIHMSSFAFNSSILWDPERWGRPSSVQDSSQNSVKFVQQVVSEDESKLKGIPQEDCSKIMLWHLYIPSRMIPFQRSPSPVVQPGGTRR
ncbi:PREDICTED: probable beta-1,4-xylosyltransferase IRX9 isoform X2 [Nelumbo nucifera]|uniref:Glycosyltransferases n=1 Tax=Nelumbo nucifera TaxID=4432 RepID=A0A1U7ZY41_NELNU|nr:PREDICTED: probable beta-1,4-xylosyltransferase IRX9 isoform X2 [Nelumbo nucifera]